MNGGDLVDINTSPMYEAIDNLRRLSVSTNSDSSAPCTHGDLRNLRDNIANVLDVIVSNMED